MNRKLFDRVLWDITTLNTPRQYTVLQSDAETGVIKLHIGVIHSNGEREYRFKTISYHVDKSGEVYTTEQVHT